MRRTILATLAVFVVWSVLDFVIHGVILQSAYAATAALWRPLGEMKMGILHASVLIAALTFVVIYARFIANKGTSTGLMYGLWFGLGAGVSMGYATYAVMPIPYHMALVWFLGTLVEGAAAGLVAALIVRP